MRCVSAAWVPVRSQIQNTLLIPERQFNFTVDFTVDFTCLKWVLWWVQRWLEADGNPVAWTLQLLSASPLASFPLLSLHPEIDMDGQADDIIERGWDQV